MSLQNTTPSSSASASAHSPSSTLFGGNSPSPTTTPSQGSITLYKDSSCLVPFSENPTPLLLGSCFNVPIANTINAVSINDLPSCPDYGTPLLVVSNIKDCRNSSAGTAADGGALGECQAFSSGADTSQSVASMEFVCYGRGVSSVAGGGGGTSQTSTVDSAAPGSTGMGAGDGDGDGDGDDDDDEDHHARCCQCECCCCCAVM